SNSRKRTLSFSLLGVIALTLASLIPSQYAEATRGQQMEIALPAINNPSALSETLNAIVNPNEAAPKWHQFTVRPGNTLAQIMDMVGVGGQQVHEIVSMAKPIRKSLTQLTPGQFLAVKVDNDSVVQELVYKQDPLTTLYIERSEKGELSSRTSIRDYERRVAYVSGVISSSLFETAQDSGMTENLIMDMAHIFGWDIDFALDIREDDRFALLYEELYLDGKKVRDGNILAAEFVNQGKSYKAVRYTNENGRADYYDDQGRSMRKAFLRTPLDFYRISSRFGKRKHPILNKWKRHTGVDYAAARGTPVKASGDGKIIYRGRKGGYGKTVIIQHGNGYRTLYGHLNNYARKAAYGTRVRQGQVIGFVGSTGRATGPHLHYEFRVRGHHRNPLTVSLPDASPIKGAQLSAFLQSTQPILTQLRSYTKIDSNYSSL
ncbi:MAG: peptidoglycan DD-metalloendopeptidase family protein, partial [Gammaproteobacteria bacterium]|nr:peptidoglycan DD-metalloendopeptidase family protein [Gammaproteobacteria bacterium]